MDADGGDGFSLRCAFGDSVSDDMLVFVDDAISGAVNAGEPAVGFERVPENAFENIAGSCFGESRAVVVNGYVCAVYIAVAVSDVFSCRFQVLDNTPISTLLVERFVYGECYSEKKRIEKVRQPEQNKK